LVVGPLGNLEGGSSTRDFERWMKEVLAMERFSQKRLSAEGLSEGSYTGVLGTLESGGGLVYRRI